MSGSQVADASSVANVASATDASQGADASAEAGPAASPFTMVTGDPSAMICTDDVCFIPGADWSA